MTDARKALQHIVDTARESDLVTPETAMNFLSAQGLVIVPREPSDEMVRAAFRERDAGANVARIVQAAIAAAAPSTDPGASK